MRSTRKKKVKKRPGRRALSVRVTLSQLAFIDGLLYRDGSRQSKQIQDAFDRAVEGAVYEARHLS